MSGIRNDALETYDSLKGIIYERLSSPLISSYAISWSILNFKLYVIAFSNGDLALKSLLIDEYFAIAKHEYYLFEFCLPLAMSFLYVFIYPFISREVNKFVLERKLDIRRDIKNAENKKIIDKEEHEEIIKKYRNEIDDYIKEIDRLNNLNYLGRKTSNTDRVATARKSKGTSAEVKFVPAPELLLDDTQKLIIKILGTRENSNKRTAYETLLSLLKASKVSTVEGRLALNRLETNGLIYVYRNELDTPHQLTPKGIEVFKEVIAATK